MIFGNLILMKISYYFHVINKPAPVPPVHFATCIFSQAGMIAIKPNLGSQLLSLEQTTQPEPIVTPIDGKFAKLAFEPIEVDSPSGHQVRSLAKIGQQPLYWRLLCPELAEDLSPTVYPC